MSWTEKRDRSGAQRLHLVVDKHRWTFACGSRFNDWGLFSVPVRDLPAFRPTFVGNVCGRCEAELARREQSAAALKCTCVLTWVPTADSATELAPVERDVNPRCPVHGGA